MRELRVGLPITDPPKFWVDANPDERTRNRGHDYLIVASLPDDNIIRPENIIGAQPFRDPVALTLLLAGLLAEKANGRAD